MTTAQINVRWAITSRRPRRHLRLGIRRLPVHLALGVLMLVWIIPVLGLLVSSLRTKHDVARSGWWTALRPPFEFTLANHAKVLDERNLGRSFLNSLAIAVPTTMLAVAVGAITGYVFARMRFRGRELFFVLVLAVLVVPLQMTLVPVLQLFRDLGILGTFPAVWIAHLGFGLPFVILVTRNYFASLPDELFEAAALDGASRFSSLLRIALPTAVPALAAVAIFEFMFVWNDLLVALIFLGGTPDVAPLTITVTNLVGSRGEGWEVLTAAAFIHMAVPLVLFFALQRYFIRGLLSGSSR